MGELIKVDFHNKKRIPNKEDMETLENELCILCGKGTRIPKSSNINDPIRLGRYMKGAGQVCENCPMD